MGSFDDGGEGFGEREGVADEDKQVAKAIAASLVAFGGGGEEDRRGGGGIRDEDNRKCSPDLHLEGKGGGGGEDDIIYDAMMAAALKESIEEGGRDEEGMQGAGPSMPFSSVGTWPSRLQTHPRPRMLFRSS